MTEPSLASRLAEVLGPSTAAALCRMRGGTEINVPVRAAGSQLARIIGEPNTEAMIAEFGPGRMTLPMAGMRGTEHDQTKRRARAMNMLRAGASQQKVALRCGLHLVTVRRYAKQLNLDTDQLDMGF